MTEVIHIIDEKQRKVSDAMVDNFLTIDATIGPKPRAEYNGERMITPNLGLILPGRGDYPWECDISNNFLKIDEVLQRVLDHQKGGSP